MLRSKGKGSQDKEVQRTLRKVNPFGWHMLPFRFYTKQYTSSCRSARGAAFDRWNSYPLVLGLALQSLSCAKSPMNSLGNAGAQAPSIPGKSRRLRKLHRIPDYRSLLAAWPAME
jgi:hypothetical protein